MNTGIIAFTQTAFIQEILTIILAFSKQTLAYRPQLS